MQDSGVFFLRVMGGLAIEGRDGSVIPGLPKRRAEAVLAVLAVAGDLGCTRDRLTSLIWPESDESRSRSGLRDALHAIRRTLGPEAITGGNLLRLNPTVVESDVHRFSLALEAGRHADAVRAGGRPLLDGFHVDAAPEFEHWLDGERRRLAREYAEALHHLANAASASGAWAEAAGWWARAVEHDPLNSHAVLRHAEALAAMGDRANAIQIADAHVARLRRELDLPPDRAFLDGIDRIRRGQAMAPRSVSAGAEPGTGMAALHADPARAERPGSAAPASGRLPDARPATRRRSPRVRLAVAVVLLLAVAATVRWASARSAHHAPRTAIAVLPFRVLGADSSNAWLAAGLHDELMSQLAGVASLRVIGRTSVGGYEGTTKPPRQIGRELGVGTIVEASVEVSGSRGRVIVRVLDVETQTGSTRSYDLALDDAFAVQSRIAREIVTQVGATVTAAESEALAAAPTRDPNAWQLFLQGEDYRRRPGAFRQNFEIAAQLFRRALARDSSFALALAALSVTDGGMVDLGYDRTPDRLERATREAEGAMRLAPQLGEANQAVGLVNLLRDQPRQALESFRRALRDTPNSAETWHLVARAQRDLGEWDSMMVAFDRARRLDPRDATLLHDLGDTYHYLHRYPEAIAAYRQELELAPDAIQGRLSLAWSYILWKGELDTLRAVLQSLPLDASTGLGGGTIGAQRLMLLAMEHRPDSLLALLRVLHPGTGPDAVLSRVILAATADRQLNDEVAARVNIDSALAILDARLRAHPDDQDAFGRRCYALALLGRADDLRADHCAERAGGDGGYRGWLLMRAGEVDSGLATIERALTGPSTLSVPYVRLSPDWAPLWQDARFRALMARYANPSG